MNTKRYEVVGTIRDKVTGQIMFVEALEMVQGKVYKVLIEFQSGLVIDKVKLS